MTQPAQPGILARRIGPVPVWLILAVIALAVFLWWRKKKAADSSGDGSSVLPGTGVIAAGAVGGSPYVYAYPGTVPVTVPTPNQPTSDPTLPGGASDTPPANTPAPAPAVTTRTYTIVSGDTVERIAAKFGKTWADVFYPNEAAIEAAAKSHGKTSSRGGPNNSQGWWIFPGTQLVIPT